MTRLRGPLALTAAVALLLITACARPADGAGEPAGAAADEPVASDQLVIRVKQEGGFMAAEMIPGRIPVVSIYADGRVITQGPQIAIYPGPAMPNLQVARVEPAVLEQLVAKAREAGVGNGADLGQPGVADVPTTVIEVRDGATTKTSAAEALREASPDDTQLTDAHRKARAKLVAFVDELIALGDSATRPYEPTALAALAHPYRTPQDDLPVQSGEIAWPGPALPGDRLAETVELGCVTVTGSQLEQVLAVAEQGNQNTPWISGGKQFGVTFRPLLPDEADCTALKAQR